MSGVALSELTGLEGVSHVQGDASVVVRRVVSDSRAVSEGDLFAAIPGATSDGASFAPGAVLPDHEHVNIEQTYVLEGSLVDKEGPAKGIEFKAGEFIWREEGSRHVAWCPQGGLMLAIFQVPNKFFEADGRIIDAAGEDWDAAWGHTRKG